MTLSELIIHVGDQNIAFQNLLRDTVSMNSEKRRSSITFAADPVLVANLTACQITGDQPKFTPLVIWLPTERLPDEFKSSTKQKGS